MITNMNSTNGLKTIFLTMVIIVVTVCILIYQWEMFPAISNLISLRVAWNSASDWKGNSSTVHIAVVICGDRVEEGTVMLKSALIFSKTYLIFHIFTEDALRTSIMNEINSWPPERRKSVQVNIYDIQFPATEKHWAKLFRPCAAQRLFIPLILTDVDSLIYMDSDSLFLSPAEDVWEHFSKFNSHQIFGVTEELSGWYADKTFPYCTQTGVNSGVMLMNLTRIRSVQWMSKLNEYYSAYKQHLTLGDQDLINIYCQFHKGQVYLLPCPFNYRCIFCPSNGPCNETETLGAYILHGNAKVFHNDLFPAVREVYRSIKEHNLATQTTRDLLNSMVSNIKLFSNTECGKRPHLFTRNVQKYVLKNEVLRRVVNKAGNDS